MTLPSPKQQTIILFFEGLTQAELGVFSSQRIFWHDQLKALELGGQQFRFPAIFLE
jgi:hypothetical protein